jgi:hypothetical protein
MIISKAEAALNASHVSQATSSLHQIRLQAASHSRRATVQPFTIAIMYLIYLV